MEIIKTKIGRRSFLKTSGALGGGLLVGFNWFLSCKTLSKRETLNSIPKEWFKINGYFGYLDLFGIAIICAHLLKKTRRY